ncbi:tryptophan halogenase family protein [Steroidobacter sp.]|uniref:tryptophan halogenase family protein n=1 Tax=Steroidobacter sp. TaxID=1978227 RepID=UPI001A4F2409|nr:tryptophan halogenase family protein [Steroidobacter sp.]MBL8271274.1 tryptophan 7-halogenase [Steroidobacter sp.]
MTATPVRKVVIAGGGTAGWVTAAALSHQLGQLLDITLVESEEIGTIGVGESTVPPIRVFHQLLGIDEQEFMRAVSATFKLGIWFENWGQIGDRYIHPFGRHGKSTWLCEFHHFWLHGLRSGLNSELGEYCVEWLAAKQGRFGTSPQSDINYAFHIDASAYARFLRRFAEGHGVKRIEGKIKSVRQHPTTGFVESLQLDGERVVPGDLFIDCTGFRALLSEQTLHTGFEDWSHWLPCDSAAAVQTEITSPPNPYTCAIAHEAGWRWLIPLQHRMGNGFVYCSRYISDEDAKQKLMQAVSGNPVRPPFTLKFKPGRRLKTWNKNVVAVGLSSGFIEPLESTSIHLIMTAATRLMQMFPFDGIRPAFVDQFNKESQAEFEKVRDFIILHYHTTERDDSPFWRYCRGMEIPESLARRIELFQEGGHAYQADGELFRVDSWIQVLLGQGVVPKHYHPLPRGMQDQELARVLHGLKAGVAQSVARLPKHQEFINSYCRMEA